MQCTLSSQTYTDTKWGPWVQTWVLCFSASACVCVGWTSVTSEKRRRSDSCALCSLIHELFCVSAEQPSEDDRQNSWSADGRAEADETASMCQRHPGGGSRYKILSSTDTTDSWKRCIRSSSGRCHSCGLLDSCLFLVVNSGPVHFNVNAHGLSTDRRDERNQERMGRQLHVLGGEERQPTAGTWRHRTLKTLQISAKGLQVFDSLKTGGTDWFSSSFNQWASVSQFGPLQGLTGSLMCKTKPTFVSIPPLSNRASRTASESNKPKANAVAPAAKDLKLWLTDHYDTKIDK